jgi:hypothetical protein
VLSETTEKHKLHKKNSKFLKDKQKQAPTGQVFGEQSNFAQNTNIMDMVPDPDPSVIDLNIGPGPIHFKAWVKYFKYASDEYQGNKPRNFFKNLEFYQQSRKYPNENMNKQKDGLNYYIKSEMYFYMMVFYDRINILTSRAEKFQKTFESLTFDLITPVVEEKDFAGGITDFGAFSEGFCFKIESSKTQLTQMPTGDVALTSWIICADSAVLFLFILERKIGLDDHYQKN